MKRVRYTLKESEQLVQAALGGTDFNHMSKWLRERQMHPQWTRLDERIVGCELHLGKEAIFLENPIGRGVAIRSLKDEANAADGKRVSMLRAIANMLRGRNSEEDALRMATVCAVIDSVDIPADKLVKAIRNMEAFSRSIGSVPFDWRLVVTGGGVTLKSHVLVIDPRRNAESITIIKEGSI